MNVYAQGTNVTSTISLDGIEAIGVSCRVLDINGGVLVAPALTDFVPGNADVSVTVLAAINVLASGVIRDIRKIELTVTSADGTRIISGLYVIEAASPLVVGVNSFQSYEVAELTSIVVPMVDAWTAAAKSSRIAALVMARTHIGQMSFPEAAVGLLNLTALEFAALSTSLIGALRLAQIVEADHILGGNWTEHKRNSGLMSETTGESSNMFRSGKAIELPICKRAAQILTGHITYAVKIGRT